MNQKLSGKRPVKSTVKNKNTSKKIPLNTGPLRSKRALLFIVFFALVGASYLYFSKADSTFGSVPTGANQIVVQYSLGMAHQVKENDLSATMPIPMLLYTNGTMICGDTSQASMPSMPDMPVNYHAKQLSKPETKAVFDKMVSLGMQQAASFQSPSKIPHPTDLADLIVLNSTKGAYYATQYPGQTNTAFHTVQQYLQQQCQKATETYNPSDVAVESAPAASNAQTVGDLSDVTTDLKADTDTTVVGTKKLATRQSGQQAAQLKTKIPLGTTGIYTVNGKKTKVRLMPKMPSYDYPKPFTPSSKNKVSAQANIRSVRWLYVIPTDMGTDGSEQGYLNELAGSIRDFYARNTGRAITINQVSVVRGSKTSWQYQQCPAGQTCSYNGVNYPSLATYYNMSAEFAQTGESTNIVYPFNTSDQCTGWGGPVSSNNYAGYSYGTSAFSRAGCYWYDGEHGVAGHENGHTYGLIHTCNWTIMDGLGSGCNTSFLSWSQQTLDGGQAQFLATQSPYFQLAPVTVSGRVYNATTGSGIAGVRIDTCVPSTPTVTTDANGNWSMTAQPGSGYCARVESATVTGISNLRGPYTNVPPAVWGSATYEYQAAGVNCYGVASCDSNVSRWDRGDDSNVSFRFVSSSYKPADVLPVNGVLWAGQTLVSRDTGMVLVMQTDGNLVVYNRSNQAIWATNTWGTGNNNRLVMQGDGNLVLYNGNWQALWVASGTWGQSNNRLVMQGDGNLVIYNGNWQALWATNTWGQVGTF